MSSCRHKLLDTDLSTNVSAGNLKENVKRASVTTAWRHGGTECCGQPTRSSPPALYLGKQLTPPATTLHKTVR
jgi:hypothetical protein